MFCVATDDHQINQSNQDHINGLLSCCNIATSSIDFLLLHPLLSRHAVIPLTVQIRLPRSNVARAVPKARQARVLRFWFHVLFSSSRRPLKHRRGSRASATPHTIGTHIQKTNRRQTFEKLVGGSSSTLWIEMFRLDHQWDESSSHGGLAGRSRGS